MSKITSDNAYDIPWVRTQNSTFRLDKPVFHIGDIAHALAMCCRFNGHINSFYSVAQHSIIVASLMEDLDLGNPLEGLLHDGTEAYLSDVPAPFKQCLPDWRAIDARLETELRKTYGLPEKKTDGCKTADWYALFMEAYTLLPGQGEDFMDPLNLRPVALDLLHSEPGRPYRLHYELSASYTPRESRNRFLNRFDEYQP